MRLKIHKYTNWEGLNDGLDPFKSGPKYTDVMKTQALKQALDAYGFDVAFGGARRDEKNQEQKKGSYLFELPDINGIREIKGLNYGQSITLKLTLVKP